MCHCGSITHLPLILVVSLSGYPHQYLTAHLMNVYSHQHSAFSCYKPEKRRLRRSLDDNKYLKGECKEDKDRLFCVGHRVRTEGSGYKLAHRSFLSSEHQAALLHYVGGIALSEVAQRGS